MVVKIYEEIGDDVAKKWQALQDWRSKFKKEDGREPTFWIDKFCIDQNNIDACYGKVRSLIELQRFKESKEIMSVLPEEILN